MEIDAREARQAIIQAPKTEQEITKGLVELNEHLTQALTINTLNKASLRNRI